MRKEKGMKLELTPIGAAGLAHTLQQPGAGGIDRAEAAAAAPVVKPDLNSFFSDMIPYPSVDPVRVFL